MKTQRFGTWVKRGIVAGFAALMTGAVAAPALANRVIDEDAVRCDGDACTTDSFEIKCAQPSSFMCVWVQENVSQQNSTQATLIVSLVATSLASALGQAVVGTIEDVGIEKTFCLAGPATDAYIKAMLSISLVPPGVDVIKPYHVEAECFHGNVIDGLSTRKTVIKLKQDD